MKISGIKQTIKNIEKLQQRVRAGLQKSQEGVGNQMLRTVKDRTDRPFQEVVSYVFESRWGLPGTNPDFGAPGLIGTFAERAPRLAHPWTVQVQKYRRGPHLLRDLLTTTTSSTAGGKVTTEVGYPKDVGARGSDTWYIVWVLFGTVKMQPRPVLRLTLEEFSEKFKSTVAQSVRQAIGVG